MIPVPIPPTEEQNEIIKIIQNKMLQIELFKNRINEIMKTKEILGRYINMLQSGVLKYAFSGKLVN